MKPKNLASSCAAVALTACAALVLPGAASAATIVGGSDLLSPAYADQLETWLGEGPLMLTNIFDKVEGDTSADFHAAADGMGATFSIVEVTGYGDVVLDTSVIVGGYNPQSWSTIGDYNRTYDIAERTAFVFNLTQSLLFRQQQSDGFGILQTYNAIDQGPTFGGQCSGDLAVYGDLSQGYSYLCDYGTASDASKDIARYPEDWGGLYWTVGAIEVFTVSAVPEPETWALMLAGLGMLGIAARRRAVRD